MPFTTIFFSRNSLASFRLICFTKLFEFPFSLSIPGVSVRRISFSALIAAEISPAAKSAFILWEIQSALEPILEITGM